MRIMLALVVLVTLSSPLAAQQRAAEVEPDTLSSEYPRWLVTGYAGSFGIADEELDAVGMTTDASIRAGTGRRRFKQRGR